MANTSSVFKQVAQTLDEVIRKLNVELVLITRNTPTHLQIEGAAGVAAKIYQVGMQQRKGSIFEEQHELYCEYLLNQGLPYLFVQDSRIEPQWDGNEDQIAFGLINYLGYPIRDARGKLFGTVCVLHTEPREYSDEDKAILQKLQTAVEDTLKLKTSHLKNYTPVAVDNKVQPWQITPTLLNTKVAVKSPELAR